MMRFSRLFPVAMCFLASTVYAAGPQATPSVQEVSGHLYEQQTGQWSADVFGPAFAPVNRMSTPLLLMVTVDLGAQCVVQEPSGEEARAIARGERQPPSRPASCDKPPGQILAGIKYGDGKHDRQSVELSRFFVGFDGKVHVPMLFYRRLPCQPIELTIGTSLQKKPLVRRVEFRCAE
jgi:hypothetical protein